MYSYPAHVGCSKVLFTAAYPEVPAAHGQCTCFPAMNVLWPARCTSALEGDEALSGRIKAIVGGPPRQSFPLPVRPDGRNPLRGQRFCTVIIHSHSGPQHLAPIPHLDIIHPPLRAIFRTPSSQARLCGVCSADPKTTTEG